MEKDHDRPMFDTSDPDWQRAFKYFVANFRDFCIMEYFINPPRDVDLDDCWIRVKRPKAMAALFFLKNGMFLQLSQTLKSQTTTN